MFFIHECLVFLLSTSEHLVGDWGIAVMLLTIAVRVVFLPLSVILAKQSVRMAAIAPELEALGRKFSKEPAKLLEARKLLLAKHGVRPVRSFFPALLQAPVFFSLFRVFESSQLAHVSTFLTPWIPALTAPDPTHILPLVAAALVGLLALVQYVPTSHRPKGMAVVSSLMASFMLWQAPIGVVLYYVTSSAWGAGERFAFGGFFRRRITPVA